MGDDSSHASSTETPPPVEVLTRGMISLFSRFASTSDSNGVTMIPSGNGQSKSLESSPQQEQKPSAYKEFLSKLRVLSSEQPNLVQQITDFLHRINNKQILESYPLFEDEDIPGCHEEFAPEITSFLNQMSRDLSKTRFWKTSSEEEILMMKENLEKLVMSKLYDHVFSPTESHRDRDKQLYLKLDRLKYVLDPVKHLDLRATLDPKTTDISCWEKAAAELAKISNFKTPRDKLVCVANACRGLVQFIKSNNESPIPDVFIPCLIYAVLLANPKDLHSNVEYICAYRGQDFLRGETGHFLLHFASAVSFIWRADAKALSMSVEEFEGAMEQNEFESKDSSDVNHRVNPFQEGSLGLRNEWFEERFKYEGIDFNELRISEMRDLFEQYQLLVRACREMLPAKPDS